MPAMPTISDDGSSRSDASMSGKDDVNVDVDGRMTEAPEEEEADATCLWSVRECKQRIVLLLVVIIACC